MRGGEKNPGIIPLSIKDIFEYVKTSKRDYLIKVSYLEIYNEDITDLLNPENTKLKIHEDLERGIFVGDLTEEIVTNEQQVFNLLNKGDANRKVGQTNMSEKSSRSHSIFRIVITSREMEPSFDSVEDEEYNSKGKGKRTSNSLIGSIKISLLNLVDLAGSERIAHTGAEGVRLKEGAHINKSLFTLERVIAKLSDPKSVSGHIPYRDSKLTRMLQTALGGNSKTSIICTMTPSSNYVEESQMTLKFASSAKNIVTRPQVNEILSDGMMKAMYEKKIHQLQEEINNLKSQLEDRKEEELIHLLNEARKELEEKEKELQLKNEEIEQTKRFKKEEVDNDDVINMNDITNQQESNGYESDNSDDNEERFLLEIERLNKQITELTNKNMDLEFHNEELKIMVKDSEEIERIEEENSLLLAKLKELEKENEQLRKRIEELESSSEEQSILLNKIKEQETSQKENEELRKKLEELEAEKEKNDILCKRIESLEEENAQNKAKIGELQAENNDLMLQINNIDINNEKVYKETIEKLESKVLQLQNENNEITHLFEELCTQSETLSKERDLLLDKLRQLEDVKHAENCLKQSLEEELKEEKQNTLDLRMKLSEMELKLKDITSLKSERDRLLEEIELKENNEKKLQERINEYENKINKMKLDKEETEKEIKELKEALDDETRKSEIRLEEIKNKIEEIDEMKEAIDYYKKEIDNYNKLFTEQSEKFKEMDELNLQLKKFKVYAKNKKSEVIKLRNVIEQQKEVIEDQRKKIDILKGQNRTTLKPKTFGGGQGGLNSVIDKENYPFVNF